MRFTNLVGFSARPIAYFSKLWLKRLLKNEHETQRFRIFNERPVEYGFVFKSIAKIYPMSVLDVGTGTTALPALIKNCGSIVSSIDNIKDYWPRGMFNKHYHVVNDDITKPKLEYRYDLITCISVLEHIVKFDDAVANMFKLLKPGGFLIITCPYSEKKYVNNVYDLPNASYGKDFPFICQSFSRVEVDQWLLANKAEVVEQEYWKFWHGEFWTVGEQVIPPIQVSQTDSHQISCMLLRKNTA